MKLYSEISDLSEFSAWSGGEDTYDKIIQAGKGEEFIQLLDDVYPDGVTETQLNDLLWFEEEWCYELVGLNKWGVEPLSGEDVINGDSRDIIGDAVREEISKFIGIQKQAYGITYTEDDFDGLDEWDFESDIDDWLEDNQGDETDEDTLAQKWLDDEGYEVIEEAVASYRK